jgi:hypothetical protein
MAAGLKALAGNKKITALHGMPPLAAGQRINPECRRAGMAPVPMRLCVELLR